MLVRSFVLVHACLAVSAVLAGCSGGDSGSLFSSRRDDRARDGAVSQVDDAAAGTGDDGSTFPVTDGCSGLSCTPTTTCQGGAKTSVTGTVYDPAGKVPLYNVIVYVPTAPVHPLDSSGATCSQCGGTVSGSPAAVTLTDAKGDFTLDNVPAGKDIPLVMQVGKWRRSVVIPDVAPCANTAIADAGLTRLPRNQAEGDIPQIAIATGGADPLECLLRKIGIDDSEFATAGGTGRIHLYAGGGWTDAKSVAHPATSQFSAALNGGVAFADAMTFWSSAANLKAYDVVLMACEGELNAGAKPLSARQAVTDFAAAGGRVFASHWHRYWFSDGPAPVPSVGMWTDRIDPATQGLIALGTVDVSFPKGQAFRDWLVNVNASTVPGQLPIKDSKHNLDSVNLAEAQQWISLPNPNANNQTAVEYATFNTPVGQPAGAQCGRVVYSDLHVSSGDRPGTRFPDGCVTADLSPQEKALEFMLFDLSSCVQTDNLPPKVPLH